MIHCVNGNGSVGGNPVVVMAELMIVLDEVRKSLPLSLQGFLIKEVRKWAEGPDEYRKEVERSDGK